MSGSRPRILDELGTELVRAARAQEDARGHGAPPRPRWTPTAGRLPRAVVLGLALALLVAAVAVAASLVIGRGDPIPSAPRGAVPRELQPVPGSAHLVGLDVADPDGGPVWDLRMSRSGTGAVCTTIGQVLGGELGIVGLDRRFRALPAGAADTCSTPQRHGATLAGARAFRGGRGLTDLTVVNGVLAPSVRRAVAVGDGRRVVLRPSSDGAFLAVFRGLPEQVRPRLVLSEASGHHTVLRFADTGEFIAPDPGGGAPWALRTDLAHVPGLRCLGARRERGPDSPQPLPPGSGDLNVVPSGASSRCGRRGTRWMLARRFVPSRALRGGNAGPWGLAPARTVVLGGVPSARSHVVLTALGQRPRTVRVDPRTQGFLAILDGHVDPRAVRVRIDGRAIQSGTGALDHDGHPAAAPGPPPAWRSVASVLRRHPGPLPLLRPDRGTQRTARRATDPTTGQHWELRTWSSTLRAHVPAHGQGRRLACFAPAVRTATGRLVVPRPGAAPRPFDPVHADNSCVPRRMLATKAIPPLVRIYVDDPLAPAPRPTRVVVAGVLGDGVRSAQLLGAGAPRPLALDAHGAFLAVLGPSAAGRDLRVRQVRAGGQIRTSTSDGIRTPCAVPTRQTFRVADPDGEAPWVAGSGRGAGGACWFLGRLVAGRVGALLPDLGVVIYGPLMGGSMPTLHHGHVPHVALWLDADPGMSQRSLAAPPTPAQVARRTLPGRTVIIGHAAPDVVSVTLRTPRDIRTVVPVHRAFLAVYDGAFYGGEVVATAHLRSGRSVTIRRPATLW